MINETFDKLVKVFAILDQYPVNYVGGYDDNLLIELDESAVVTNEHKAQLRELSTLNQTCEHSWEVIL